MRQYRNEKGILEVHYDTEKEYQAMLREWTEWFKKVFGEVKK